MRQGRDVQVLSGQQVLSGDQHQDALSMLYLNVIGALDKPCAVDREAKRHKLEELRQQLQMLEGDISLVQEQEQSLPRPAELAAGLLQLPPPATLLQSRLKEASGPASPPAAAGVPLLQHLTDRASSSRIRCSRQSASVSPEQRLKKIL